MKLVFQSSDNVACFEDGCIWLKDSFRHGYVVFAPASTEHFEVRLTARTHDLWDDYDKAGAYCLGIVHREDVTAIRPADDGVHFSIFDMQNGVRLCALSTGTFRFSDRLFDHKAWRLFWGSLNEGRTLIMNFHNGRLRYQLDGQEADVTPYASCLNSDVGPCDEQVARPTFVPALWLFSNAERRWIERGGILRDNGIVVQCRTSHIDLANKTLTRLWDDRSFADCSIDCKNEHFPAHRAVLCAASPVFKAAFTGNMREACDSRFEVRGCDSPLAVRALLEFLYKGLLPDLELDVLLALLPLAIQYEVDDLCTIAAERLVDFMNVQNARAIVKTMRQFREHRTMTDPFNCVVCLLKADDDLLSEALV